MTVSRKQIKARLKLVIVEGKPTEELVEEWRKAWMQRNKQRAAQVARQQRAKWQRGGAKASSLAKNRLGTMLRPSGEEESE